MDMAAEAATTARHKKNPAPETGAGFWKVVGAFALSGRNGVAAEMGSVQEFMTL